MITRSSEGVIYINISNDLETHWKAIEPLQLPEDRFVNPWVFLGYQERNLV